jgi:hypothetical protein
MKEVSAGGSASLQVLPAIDVSVDELHDALVPPHEDELPQGVLDLLASLVAQRVHSFQSLKQIVRETPGPSLLAQSPGAEAEHQGARQVPAGFMERDVPLPRVAAHALPQPVHFDAVMVRQMPIERSPGPVERSSGPVEHSPAPVELLPDKRLPRLEIPARRAADTPLPETMTHPHTVRHAPPVAQASVSLSAMPKPAPMLDSLTPAVTGSPQGMLQIPFNKGAVSGQVTITRAADESAPNLLLSPSSTLVFEQLKTPFEQIRNPAWQLGDHPDERQHQGRQPSPDDEPDDQRDLPA